MKNVQIKSIILGILFILVALVGCKKEEKTLDLTGTYHCTDTHPNNIRSTSYYIFHNNKSLTYYYKYQGKNYHTDMTFTFHIKGNYRYAAMDYDSTYKLQFREDYQSFTYGNFVYIK